MDELNDHALPQAQSIGYWPASRKGYNKRHVGWKRTPQHLRITSTDQAEVSQARRSLQAMMDDDLWMLQVTDKTSTEEEDVGYVPEE